MKRLFTLIFAVLAFNAALTGIGFLATGFFVRRAYQPFNDGIETNGRVTDNSQQPSITFVAEDGEKVEFTEYCTSTSRFDKDEEVRVSYRPAEPSRARNLDSKCKVLFQVFVWIGVVGLGVAGVLSLLFAACLCCTGGPRRT